MVFTSIDPKDISMDYLDYSFENAHISTGMFDADPAIYIGSLPDHHVDHYLVGGNIFTSALKFARRLAPSLWKHAKKHVVKPLLHHGIDKITDIAVSHLPVPGVLKKVIKKGAEKGKKELIKRVGVGKKKVKITRTSKKKPKTVKKQTTESKKKGKKKNKEIITLKF